MAVADGWPPARASGCTAPGLQASSPEKRNLRAGVSEECRLCQPVSNRMLASVCRYSGLMEQNLPRISLDAAGAAHPEAGRAACLPVPVAAGLRADAERNRERILGAAQELFTKRGLETPLEDIAQRAGVGIATLYRRFPTRCDLVAAVFERRISCYSDVVERGLSDPDPWRGFCAVVTDLCALQASDAGLKDLVTMRFPGASGLEGLKVETLKNLEALVARARQHGCLRTDFDLADLTMMLLANAGLVTATRCSAPEVWRRFAAYMIQSFRADHAAPLPPPATFEQMERSFAEVAG
jgi:AcrR family transcriptional regulator